VRLTLEQVLLLLLGAGALMSASALLAALFRQRSFIAFALATNLVASALVVGFTFALSAIGEVSRAWTWFWLLAVLVIAGGCWRARGRPRPSIRAPLTSLRAALGDPIVSFTAGVVTSAFVYVIALSVATPENEGDALAYHVARAAFWYQDHRIGYIRNAIETRLNVNPPNAEIGDLFTMLLTGSQRFVGLVQVAALVVCVLAAVGIARRGGGRASLRRCGRACCSPHSPSF
jgi:hypothetical protein